jgi:hypothetical protein
MRQRVWAGCIAAVVAAGLVFAQSASATVGSIPVGLSWQTNGRVQQIVINGTTAYMVGNFTSVRPSGAAAGTGEVARGYGAAVNLATGALLPWNPAASSTIQTAVVSGSTVYLGGLFTTVGGKSHAHLAAVDATTGAVNQTWKAKANAQVMSLALGANGLYAGGAFTSVDGAARNYLAEVDLTTGAQVPGFAGQTNNKVNAVALTAGGSRLVIGGTFTTVNGTNQGHIAAVDPATGATLPWAIHPAFGITTLAVDAGGVYAAGTGAGGTVVAFAPSTGQQLWVAGLDGNDQAIAVMGGIVYVGGHFNHYCGPTAGVNGCTGPAVAARNHLLALDEVTGSLQAWHPSANGVLGVFSLAAGSGTLEAGGDFTKIGGVLQQGFAEFPVITNPVVTDTAGGQPTTASSVTVTASGSTDGAPGFAGYRYQTSTNGGTTWSVNHNQSTVTVTVAGTTLVRFQAYDGYGNASDWVTDTVTIQPAQGSASVSFTASGTGTAGSTGNATIHGTYTCSGAGAITVSGTLTEPSTAAQGSFSLQLACPNSTTSAKWQTAVKPAGSAVFAAGSASVSFSWSATDLSNNQPIGGTIAKTVTLS